VDVWTSAAVPPAHAGRRVGWCDVWLRAAPGTNPYAHPVAGLKLVVDLNTMELLEIRDRENPGFPEVMGEYAPKHIPGYAARTSLRPLEISQPEASPSPSTATRCGGRTGGCGSGSRARARHRHAGAGRAHLAAAPRRRAPARLRTAVLGVDVVEVAPAYDHAEITALLANRVVLEVLSGMARRRRDASDGSVWDPRQPLLDGR
jgi:hypothetical protein